MGNHILTTASLSEKSNSFGGEFLSSSSSVSAKEKNDFVVASTTTNEEEEHKKQIQQQPKSKFNSLRAKALELWFRFEEEEEKVKEVNEEKLLIDKLYENRWFIKHSDVQKRTDLDAKISSQFGQLLDELQSFYYHNHSHHHEFVQECLDAIEENARVGGTLFPEITIATVVTLDQFSRHHFRRRSLVNEAETNIALLDEVCVTIVDRCLEKIDVTSSHSIDAKHLVFLLMPYRHTQKTLPKLKKIIDCLDKRVDSDSASLELLKKFKKTTLRCYQDLEGKQLHPETNGEILEFF